MFETCFISDIAPKLSKGMSTKDVFLANSEIEVPYNTFGVISLPKLQGPCFSNPL